MKLIIIILFATTLHLQAQDYSQQAKAAREKTNEMLQEDIDRLTHPIGHVIIDQHDMSVGSADLFWNPKDDPKEVFKGMVIGYLESRDSVEVHFNNGMFCFIVDHISGRCENKEHYRMAISTPSFQGFIEYVLKQP